MTVQKEKEICYALGMAGYICPGGRGCGLPASGCIFYVDGFCYVCCSKICTKERGLETMISSLAASEAAKVHDILEE